ncbi:MAG TPA: FAD-dependent oxidoreductase [Chthoniobacteraceae bacterium]|jgi:flavin-dependent dehydrogenase
MSFPDVIVIGGGLAGSAAGVFLARAGKRVTLFEKEAFAHHKVCGEFLSVEAQTYLTSLGLDLGGLGAATITRLRLVRGRRMVETALPFKAASLSRHRLDEALLLLAERSGVEVKRGLRIERLVRKDAHWQAVHANGDESAPTVFLATGKHDLSNLPRRHGIQNGYLGLKQHFRLAPAQQSALAGHTEMFLFEGGYAGLQPIEDGLANLCLIVTKQRFAQVGKGWNSLLDDLTSTTPLLLERLQNAVPCWDQPLAIFKIPYGFVYPAAAAPPSSFYRLGDQMAVIPSFAGDGMAIALYTASLAASSYSYGSPADYHATAARVLSPQIRYATLLSHLSTHPLCGRILLPLFAITPPFLRRIISRTRIRNFDAKRV